MAIAELVPTLVSKHGAVQALVELALGVFVVMMAGAMFMEMPPEGWDPRATRHVSGAVYIHIAIIKP